MRVVRRPFTTTLPSNVKNESHSERISETLATGAYSDLGYVIELSVLEQRSLEVRFTLRSGRHVKGNAVYSAHGDMLYFGAGGQEPMYQ